MGKQWKQCQTLFLGAPKSLQMVTAAMKLKDAYSLEGKLLLDEKISRLNKIISAIDGLSSDDLRKVETSEAILSDLKIDKSTKRGDLNKTIEEVKFERQVLNEQFHDMVEKYKTYQSVKENVRDRENDTIKNKEVKRRSE